MSEPTVRAVTEPTNLDAEVLLGAIRRQVDTLPFPEDRAARLRCVLHSFGYVVLVFDDGGKPLVAAPPEDGRPTWDDLASTLRDCVEAMDAGFISRMQARKNAEALLSRIPKEEP